MAPKASKKDRVEDQLPEGFEPVSTNLSGFFIVEEGNSVTGVIVGFFINTKSKFGPKKVYKIQVASGTTRVMSKDDGEKDAEEGDIIGLDESGYLKKLGDIEPGKMLFIKCIGREETAKKGQQPAWKYLIGQSEGKIPF